MSVRLEIDDHSDRRVILRHNTRQRAQISYDYTQTEEENGRTEIIRPAEIRQGGVQARRERHATEEKRNAQIREKRKDREEPEAGNRDRFVRGSKEGLEGPPKAHGTKELKWTKADRLTLLR